MKYTFDQMKQISEQSPALTIKKLGFNETIRLVCTMLMHEKWDRELQEFATSLLKELQKEYADRWNSSWRFDGLLGFASDIIMDYDERYKAFARALDKVKSAPPELLIAYARCYRTPGKPPITEEEAISIAKEAIKDRVSVEGAMLLRGLYKSTKNLKEQLYWDNILNQIKETGEHVPSLDKIPGITDEKAII